MNNIFIIFYRMDNKNVNSKSPLPQKKKKCKVDCSKLSPNRHGQLKKCNFETGRCKVIANTPKKKKNLDSVPKPSPLISPQITNIPSKGSLKQSSEKKKKPCKVDCAKLGRNHNGLYRECNHETGRCKIVEPKPILLEEKDCRYNEQLNEKKTKCISMPFSKRYDLFTNHKVYFTINPVHFKKATEIGAQWDKDVKKLYYTSDLPLGKIMKLNYLSLEKPKKIFLEKEDVPYEYRYYAKQAGAHWDATAKLWYYFENLPKYNIFMLKSTDWKHFEYRLRYEMM